QSKTRSAVRECCIGGLAGSLACIVTNPLEVAKTRKQLQGELLPPGAYARHYGGVLSTLATIARADGALAIQRGLAPGMAYQGRPVAWRCVVFGAACGALGGFAASPLYLIKTRLQAQSSLAVGHQHHLRGTWHGLVSLWSQGGLLSMWKGSTAQTARVMVGSSVQLATFSVALRKLEDAGLSVSPLLMQFLASCLSALAVTSAMSPLDTLSTRIYNQPYGPDGRGLVYSGLLDALVKVVRVEGLTGLYKGAMAVFLRLGPHTVLSLVIWARLRHLLPEASPAG
uniref:Solute carrier family 25 member 35 n=1 Tax=Macrostomum lignano TaxID=282301 RepID=A0A1I8HP99_9PLAT